MCLVSSGRIDEMGWGMKWYHNWVAIVALVFSVLFSVSTTAQSGGASKLSAATPKITVDSECIRTKISGTEKQLFLENKCAEDVRYVACLITVDKHDNCFPMAIGGDPTIWPIRGGSLMPTLPVARIQSYSVLGCPPPLVPWNVKWDNVRLSGKCVDENMIPMKAAGDNPLIPLADKPETWPGGTTNDSCLVLSDTLYQYTMQLNVRCETDQNLIVCMDAYPASGLGTPLIPFHTCTGMSDYDPTMPENVHAGSQTLIASPNRISKWAAFGCPVPLVPRGLSFDGRFIHGRCESPDKPKEPDIFASLPTRKADKAKTMLSDSLDTEQGAARTQIAANEATRREGDIEERARQADAVFGAIVSTAAQTYIQYEAAKAQQTVPVIIPPNSGSGNAGPVSSSNPSSDSVDGSGSKSRQTYVQNANSCVSVINEKQDSTVEDMIWFSVKNSCPYPVNFWNQGSSDSKYLGELTRMKPTSVSGRSWRTGMTMRSFACPAEGPNGESVHKDGEVDGASCYYWKRD